MMAVLVAPMAVRSLPAVEMQNAAEDLRGSFRSARAIAIRDNRESWVLIDINARTHKPATAGRAETVPDGLTMEMVVARSELIEPGRGRIRFYPDGTSTGGSVRLIGDRRSVDVKVDWFDGSVDVVDADAQ